MAFITVLLLATAVVASDAHGDTAGSNALQLVEIALNNISSQISVLKTREEQIPAYLGESLTSVTSLLQLSLLREMVTDKKDSDECSSIGTATPDEVSSVVDSYQEYITNITDSIQQAIDQRIANIENQQRSLQNQVSSQLSSIQNTISMLQNTLIQLLSSPNTHQETLDNISDCIANDTDPLPHSCEDILVSSPRSPSDYYTIADSNGHTRQVYCHMDKDICDSQGGWTRIAMINMTDTEQTCPYGFKLYNVNGVRFCGRFSRARGCVSTAFQSNQVTYSQVCGKVLGYQFGATDGAISSWDINSAYIDGISLTHGYPRYHIWSFISGYNENHYSACPCDSSGARATPSFVGTDYYCESGYPGTSRQRYPQLTLYTGDILWDGSGCGSNEQSCCTRAGMPWFYKPLPYTTSDPIELRVCGDDDTNNEDVPFSHIELYIK